MNQVLCLAWKIGVLIIFYLFGIKRYAAIQYIFPLVYTKTYAAEGEKDLK